MLNVTDEFKAFLFNNQVRSPLVRVVFENTGTDAVHGLKSYDVEITEFVSKFGSINRELDLEHGLFRPGSNSLVLKNTKDFGDYLFSLRKYFGDLLWNDKTYHIYFGFKQFPTAISVAGGLPKLSTLGFGGTPAQIPPTSSPLSHGLGDTPAGEQSIDTVSEKTVRLYTGDIQDVTYDRINEVVNIASRDFYQRLVGFKICKPIIATEIFNIPSGSTDNRAIQQVIKYGTHKLVGFTSGNNNTLTDRNNPFSATICTPNIVTCDTKYSSAGSKAANHIYYLPFENLVTYDGFATGTLKLWYWDYIARIWRSFPASYFTNNYIKIYYEWTPGRVNPKGIFFVIVSPANCLVEGDTWTQYLAGNGTYFTVESDTSKIDAAICSDSLAYGQTNNCNPVHIIYNLLANAKFLNIDQYLTDIIDVDNWATSTYTFDAAYIFYDQEGIEVNVDYNKEISIAEIIEDVCSLVGSCFYITADKNDSSRRCIKLKIDKVHNPCTQAPPSLISFSTKDRLFQYETRLSKNDYYDRVILMAFDSSYSTKNNFDIISIGSGNKSIQLGSQNVYFYNCTTPAAGIANRLYNKFCKPAEIMELETDASGMITELADFIKVHDHKLDEEIVGEVFKTNFDLDNKIKISARRYTKLFGPDEMNPYKVYAFCECAHAGTNAEGGSGTDASITIGDKTVTFVDTLDLNLIKVKMALRIDSTMFWIASITDTHHVEISAAAAATLSNKAWSAGKSYHVR